MIGAGVCLVACLETSAAKGAHRWLEPRSLERPGGDFGHRSGDNEEARGGNAAARTGLRGSAYEAGVRDSEIRPRI